MWPSPPAASTLPRTTTTPWPAHLTTGRVPASGTPSSAARASCSPFPSSPRAPMPISPLWSGPAPSMPRAASPRACAPRLPSRSLCARRSSAWRTRAGAWTSVASVRTRPSPSRGRWQPSMIPRPGMGTIACSRCAIATGVSAARSCSTARGAVCSPRGSLSPRPSLTRPGTCGAPSRGVRCAATRPLAGGSIRLRETSAS